MHATVFISFLRVVLTECIHLGYRVCVQNKMNPHATVVSHFAVFENNGASYIGCHVAMLCIVLLLQLFHWCPLKWIPQHAPGLISQHLSLPPVQLVSWLSIVLSCLRMFHNQTYICSLNAWRTPFSTALSGFVPYRGLRLRE